MFDQNHSNFYSSLAQEAEVRLNYMRAIMMYYPEVQEDTPVLRAQFNCALYALKHSDILTAPHFAQ